MSSNDLSCQGAVSSKPNVLAKAHSPLFKHQRWSIYKSWLNTIVNPATPQGQNLCNTSRCSSIAGNHIMLISAAEDLARDDNSESLPFSQKRSPAAPWKFCKREGILFLNSLKVKPLSLYINLYTEYFLPSIHNQLPCSAVIKLSGCIL